MPTLLTVFSTSVYLRDGLFSESGPFPSGWFHFVLNYLGPNEGEGIRIFINGAQADADTEKSSIYTQGDGRVVIGRFRKDEDNSYASIQVDELIFLDTALSSGDIQSLQNVM